MELVYHAMFNRDRHIHLVASDLDTCESLGVLFRIDGFQYQFSTTFERFRPVFDHRVPDVVVLDWAGEDTARGIEELRARKAGTSIVCLCSADDAQPVLEALRLGASEVVLKPIDKEELLRRVRDLLRGQLVVSRGSDLFRTLQPAGFSALTRREREVLQLVVDGQSNKEAGRLLGISPRTIEVHRARIMEKLGARNTADLVAKVLR